MSQKDPEKLFVWFGCHVHESSNTHTHIHSLSFWLSVWGLCDLGVMFMKVLIHTHSVSLWVSGISSKEVCLDYRSWPSPWPVTAAGSSLGFLGGEECSSSVQFCSALWGKWGRRNVRLGGPHLLQSPQAWTRRKGPASEEQPLDPHYEVSAGEHGVRINPGFVNWLLGVSTIPTNFSALFS